MWCFRVQTHLVPQPFHPHILFVSQFAISASDSSLIFRSECKDENTHRCRYVLISISLCLSISLGAESFPHSIRGNKAFLLHAFTSSPVFFSPPSFKLNFSLACAVLLAALCEKTQTKLPFPFPTAWLQHYISSQLFPWKIQHVSLWRVAQDLGTFWGWFCLRCNGVCECQFYTELQTTSMHRAGT